MVVPVADSVEAAGKGSVKVTVTTTLKTTGEVEDRDAREPQVGATVSGTLTDEDGGVTRQDVAVVQGGVNTVGQPTLLTICHPRSE